MSRRISRFMRARWLRSIRLFYILLLALGFAVVSVAIVSIRQYAPAILQPELATIASEIAIAVFTGIVALLEVSRYVRGPNLSLHLKDDMELEVEYYSTQNGTRHVASFVFPFVISNTGPRGGAVANIQIQLTKPANLLEHSEDGKAERDRVGVSFWWMNDSEGEVFRYDTANAMSVRDNESVALTVRLDIALVNAEDNTLSPNHTFPDLQKRYRRFELVFRFDATKGRRGTLVTKATTAKIRPNFVPRI